MLSDGVVHLQSMLLELETSRPKQEGCRVAQPVSQSAAKGHVAIPAGQPCQSLHGSEDCLQPRTVGSLGVVQGAGAEQCLLDPLKGKLLPVMCLLVDLS